MKVMWAIFFERKRAHMLKKAYLGKKRGGIWYISKRNVFAWIEIIKTLNFAKHENKQSSENGIWGKGNTYVLGKSWGPAAPQVHIPPLSPSLDKNLRRSLRPSMVPCMCPEQSKGFDTSKIVYAVSKILGFLETPYGIPRVSRDYQGFWGIPSDSRGF